MTPLEELQLQVNARREGWFTSLDEDLKSLRIERPHRDLLVNKARRFWMIEFLPIDQPSVAYAWNLLVIAWIDVLLRRIERARNWLRKWTE